VIGIIFRELKSLKLTMEFCCHKVSAELLTRAAMISCKPVNTPLSTPDKLSAHHGDLLGTIDATTYRSIV
jgi:hypothetical protein